MDGKQNVLGEVNGKQVRVCFVIELLSVFGFAGASLYALVRKGLLTRQDAEQLLRDLRHELVTA